MDTFLIINTAIMRAMDNAYNITQCRCSVNVFFRRFSTPTSLRAVGKNRYIIIRRTVNIVYLSILH